MVFEKILTIFPSTIPRAAAQLQTGNFGIESHSGTLKIPQVALTSLNVFINTITAVCVAIFIAGALFLGSSAGNDQRKSLGKDLMIGAVMGIAIVAASKTILNLTYSFLYAP